MRHRQLIVAVVALLATTLGGQLTAVAAPLHHRSSVTTTVAASAKGTTKTKATKAKTTKGSRHGAATTTTTTLAKVPKAAEPLLKRLVAVAGGIGRDEQQAAALSQRYDQVRLDLQQARARVARLDGSIRRAGRTLGRARVRLREAAIEAYVTGDTAALDESFLSNDLSQGSMVAVYGSLATGQVKRAAAAYAGALKATERLAAIAQESSAEAAGEVATIRSLKVHADALERGAKSSLRRIRTRLLALVGRREFARLVSPSPVGSRYRGPNLAGTAVGHVASPAEGRRAVAAAIRLLGVPYLWGGASRSGVDCSGLTMLSWRAAGLSIEHAATAQWEESAPVGLSHLAPGDLLFYHFAHDGSTAITHVVMYVGSGPYGKATVIQAAQQGTVVSYAPIFFGGLVSAGRP